MKILLLSNSGSETLLMLIALAMIYSAIHFIILLSQKRKWSDRTDYEKIISVVGIISLAFIGISIINYLFIK